MIAPEASAAFVANMEDVRETAYRRRDRYLAAGAAGLEHDATGARPAREKL